MTVQKHILSFLISKFVWWEPIILVNLLIVSVLLNKWLWHHFYCIKYCIILYSTFHWTASPASVMQSGGWELVPLQEFLLLSSRIPWMLLGLDWLCSHRPTKCTEVGVCDCLCCCTTQQHNNTTTQHNATQHKTTQHNATQHISTTQHNTTQQHKASQHNTTQHHNTSTQHNTT